jgi:hypothetical protein
MTDARLPVALIVLGAAWLLWYLQWIPDVNWLVAAALMVGGVAILVLDGITKKSVVAGPFLFALGIAVVLHQGWYFSWRGLLPVLLMLLGVLMLIARRSDIPMRRGERSDERTQSG